MTDRQKPSAAPWFGARFSASLNMLIRNMADTGRGRKQLISISTDMALVSLCLWGAYSVRHGMAFSDFKSTWYIFLCLPLFTAALFAGLGVYRWVIRSSNQRLYRQLVKGGVASGLLLLVAFFLMPPDRPNPRSLFIIYTLLLVTATVGVRIVWKSFFDFGSKGEPVAIYGAGSGGMQLAGLLSAGGEYRPVAFVDDDLSLAGSTLSGLPVFEGSSSNLQSQLRRLEVQSIVLAMPSIASNVYHKKLTQLDDMNLRVLTMPSVGELMTGKKRVDEIRDVSIKDILGRQEVKPDLELMAKRVTGKTVLVTGGGGSIGSELCRQIMKLAPAKLLILDNCEANLYHIDEEFRALDTDSKDEGPVAPFKSLICSVTDNRRIESLFAKENIQTVFHAAAYKHVPIVEAQPDQGVDVNVFGTMNVLDAAIRHRAENFVLISTDKAVRPTNAMGGTKRIAELVLQAKARTQDTTKICMVRFGNVLGSSGSVVPKFTKQIKAGGPITLTDLNITRYFMTIPEAAQLVLQACAIAKGGDVFVLDMGEPVRIEDLATSMVRLYGKKLQRDTGNSDDIKIVVEGLRPGEKMYEELFLSGSCTETGVAKISTAHEVWLEWHELKRELDELTKVALLQNPAKTKELIISLAFLDNSQHEDKSSLSADDVGREYKKMVI